VADALEVTVSRFSRSSLPLVLSGFGIVWLSAATLSVFGAQQPAWVSFQSEDAGFSIELPTNPTASTLTTSSFIGDVTSHLFTSWEGNVKFTVDYSEIPRFALDFAGAATIYDHARGALLKQLLYDTPPVPGKPEMYGAANLFLVGDRLYVADAAVPAGASEADAKRFLESIRFE
jgi:hypothetical protein